MKSINLILALVSIALASAKSALEFRIINGHDAQDGQFKYQASLRIKSSGKHNCGASILTERYLITAAHCCEKYYGSPEFLFVVVGSVHQFGGGKAMDLDKIETHDGFRYDTAKNDIALVRTTNEIQFNDKIQPIALPTEDVADRQPVVVSGWGAIEVINE